MRDYKYGMAEAWEIAKRIFLSKENGGFGSEQLKEIFGTAKPEILFEKYTPQQAKEKIAQWEEAMEEIQVGDVVKVTFPVPRTGVVIAKADDYVVWFNENLVVDYRRNRIRKTGQTINIQNTLKRF
ncbi:MAG: hypothetical protein OSJ62_13025 [Lachnospiraceae bacterium]|nr:hypothetical protein [Lachnospiraceae bacterium]